MGLFMTLEDASAEEAALLWEGVLPEAVPGEAAEGRPRVFDLHCDTLDRLAFHGDPSVPGGFAAHDARIPAARMSSLADNDAHVSLSRTEPFAWCQCFAAFVPDEARGDAAWALFERVRRVWERELERCGDKLARARSMADVDAALARKPGLILVDELAHTNAPGSRHAKRYRDVEELLHAGIDVFTTVNVQHLESLNDKVSATTEVVVQERIPDRIFDYASSVELVDLDPDDLLERLEGGKIYGAERAETALANFFSKKNLAYLRELALRRTADRLNRNLERGLGRAAGDAGDDVLVHVSPSAGNATVIRAAARLAAAYRGTLTALVMEPVDDQKLSEEDARALHANVELAEELGEDVSDERTPLQKLRDAFN